MINIKKILVIFLIFPVFFLGGCELFKSKTYLKDVVSSYEEYDKAVIFNPINNEEYVLNEEEYNDIVLLIDKFYDFEVSHIDIFEGADEPQSEKMNYVSTQNDATKPMPSSPRGRYVLYLFNLKTNTHLHFAYDTVFEVFDSASHKYYHIKLDENSHTSILNFGRYIANLYESKFNEILLSDISYIVIDEGGLSIEEKYNKHQISLKPATLKLYIKDSYHVVVERPSFRLLVDLRRKCKFEKLALKHPKRKFIYIPIIALLIGLFIAFNIAGNMGAI